MQAWPGIAAALRRAGVACRPEHTPASVAGGDISAGWRAATDDGCVFLKSGPPEALAMFEAEFAGLEELASAAAVRVPTPLAAIAAGDRSVLALEWLDLERPDESAARRFGEELAGLHRHTGPHHGWVRDNTIGKTPQPNTPDDNWVRFFRDRRLCHQLRLAEQNGYGGELQAEGAWLAARLERLFAGYSPAPSMLHGDLWGGNWAAADGVPVMFDPAFHYGDRECDIAMTGLFGGFPPVFYRAYEERWPLAPGFEARSKLYRLYHVLNHLNLFGGGYLGQAMALLGDLRKLAAYSASSTT